MSKGGINLAKTFILSFLFLSVLLDKIWKSNHIPTQLKINIFRTSCVSILLYGCETWILSKTLEDYINSYATNCYSPE